MSFQLSVLKILKGQPDGRASLALVKQYLAVFYTSGSEWTDRMKQLAERAPTVDIFGQRPVVREPGEWRITEEGKAFLASLENAAAAVAEEPNLDQLIGDPEVVDLPPLPIPLHRRIDDRKRRRGPRRGAEGRTPRSA